MPYCFYRWRHEVDILWILSNVWTGLVIEFKINLMHQIFRSLSLLFTQSTSFYSCILKSWLNMPINFSRSFIWPSCFLTWYFTQFFHIVKNALANGCSALTTAQIFCIIFVYYKTCMTAKWLHNPVNCIKKQRIQGLHDIFI